jgi:hypothetical protein
MLRPSFLRNNVRRVTPSAWPTLEAIWSTLARVVLRRCTARSTRRYWKKARGDLPQHALHSARQSALAGGQRQVEVAQRRAGGQHRVGLHEDARIVETHSRVALPDVEYRGQAGIEHTVECEDVDAHGNYDIKVGNLADTATAASGLLCASR